MVKDSIKRRKPNILVTGTPGTGKTTTSTALAEATQLNHINIGDLVKEKNLHDGWDDELDSYILNEDLVSYQSIYLRPFLYFFLFGVVSDALGLYEFKFKLLAHPLSPSSHVILLMFNPFASILNHSLISLLLIMTIQYFGIPFTKWGELSVVPS